MPKQNQKQSVFFHENLESWEILWAVYNEKYWYFLYYWKTSNLNHASALRKEFAYLMLTKAHRTTRLEPVGWMISAQVQQGPHGRWVTLSNLLFDFSWLGSPHHHQPPAPCHFCLSGHTSCHVESQLPGISVTWPGIEPLHPVPEVQIVNHLTSGVPVLPLLITDNENWLPPISELLKIALDQMCYRYADEVVLPDMMNSPFTQKWFF